MWVHGDICFQVAVFWEGQGVMPYLFPSWSCYVVQAALQSLSSDAVRHSWLLHRPESAAADQVGSLKQSI